MEKIIIIFYKDTTNILNLLYTSNTINKIMTVLESLACMTPLNIDNIIERICIERELDPEADYDLTYKDNTFYILAKADVYMHLYMVPDSKEQDISITLPNRSFYFSQAQKIYSQFEESSFEGCTWGYIGNKFNKIK